MEVEYKHKPEISKRLLSRMPPWRYRMICARPRKINFEIFISRKNKFSKNLEKKIPVIVTSEHFPVALIVFEIMRRPRFVEGQGPYFGITLNIDLWLIAYIAQWLARAGAKTLVPVRIPRGSIFEIISPNAVAVSRLAIKHWCSVWKLSWSNGQHTGVPTLCSWFESLRGRFYSKVY